MKDEFFMAIYLFLALVSAVFSVGLCVYVICTVEEIWLRLFCWFGSVVCLAGAILVIWVIKTIYFDEE